MDGYLGEIRAFAGNYAPKDWALCNGAKLTITGNEALYALLGTMYGGDGRATFGIPDLRGRIVVKSGQGTGLSNYTLGTVGGTEGVSLTSANWPVHNHGFLAVSSAATAQTPTANQNLLGAKNDTNNPTFAVNSFVPGGLAGQTIVDLNQNIVSTAGGLGSAHENRMAYVTISYIICLVGVYPTSN